MCLPHLKESTVAEENFFSRVPSQYAECVTACVKYVNIKEVRWDKLKYCSYTVNREERFTGILYSDWIQFCTLQKSKGSHEDWGPTL